MGFSLRVRIVATSLIIMAAIELGYTGVRIADALRLSSKVRK